MKTFIKFFPISQISTGNIWKMILAIAIHIVVGALLAGLITSTLGNIAIIGAPLTNLIGGILGPYCVVGSILSIVLFKEARQHKSKPNEDTPEEKEE